LSFAAEPSGNKSTAKDIAKKADETGQAIKNYTVAQRDEAIKNARPASIRPIAQSRCDRSAWTAVVGWTRPRVLDGLVPLRHRVILDRLAGFVGFLCDVLRRGFVARGFGCKGQSEAASSVPSARARTEKAMVRVFILSPLPMTNEAMV